MKKDKNNLSLWESVSVTDPKHTREVKVGARKFTAVDAYYQLKTATEVFGSFGDGYGLENIDHKLEKLEGTPVTLLITKAVFYYYKETTKKTIPLTTSTPLVYVTGKGKTMTDDEAFKKNETDLITKALSRLGFNSDVFLGKYDDSRYINTLKEKFEKEEAIEKAEDQRRKQEEFKMKKEELKKIEIIEEAIPDVVKTINEGKLTLEKLCEIRTVSDEIKQKIESELLKTNK
jgi:hypothetical protein